MDWTTYFSGIIAIFVDFLTFATGILMLLRLLVDNLQRHMQP